MPRDSLVAPYALPAEPFRAVFDAMEDQREVVPPPVADPTESALIAKVRANPSDPAPAHVYADWLDEHGRGAEADVLRPLLHTE